MFSRNFKLKFFNLSVLKLGVLVSNLLSLTLLFGADGSGVGAGGGSGSAGVTEYSLPLADKETRQLLSRHAYRQPATVRQLSETQLRNKLALFQDYATLEAQDLEAKLGQTLTMDVQQAQDLFIELVDAEISLSALEQAGASSREASIETINAALIFGKYLSEHAEAAAYLLADINLEAIVAENRADGSCPTQTTADVLAIAEKARELWRLYRLDADRVPVRPARKAPRRTASFNTITQVREFSPASISTDDTIADAEISALDGDELADLWADEPPLDPPTASSVSAAASDSNSSGGSADPLADLRVIAPHEYGVGRGVKRPRSPE